MTKSKTKIANLAVKMRAPGPVANAFRALLPAGLLVLASCSRSTHADTPPDPPVVATVAVAQAIRQDLSHVLEIASEFRPYQEIEVYAKVAGYVKKINVDYGSRVSLGQVMAVLEVPEMVDELERSVAATRQAEEQVTTAEAELRRAESVHDVTHLEYTRLAAVMEKRPGLVAQQDVDSAFGKDQEAEAKAAADKSALAAAQQELQVTKANERKVRTLLAYTQITAPFPGVITKRYADTGAMIQQGTASHTQAMPLVRLAQTDTLRLVIPVPETDVPRIKLGERVDVTVTALNRTFQGHVARFSDQLDLDTRTMHTEVDVPNPNLVLVPGMYATARLILEQSPHALAVPIQAIKREQDRTAVFRVKRDGTVEECPVKLGIEAPSQVEITSGLQEGDLVVIGDLNALRPGEKVLPKMVSEGSAKGRS